MVPIIFSGVLSSLLTSRARALPSCSSACMRAREAAVSDVSLALKNADSAMRKTIATMIMAMLAVMGVGKLPS